MILTPPDKFDSNEWFLLVVMAMMLVALTILPFKLPKLHTVCIVMFNIFIGQTADLSIGVPPFDLYDINDYPSYEYFDFIMYAFVYTPVAYISVCTYARWKPERFRLALFVIGWAVLTTGLEYIAVRFHVFNYKGWNLAYSLPVYIGVYIANVWVYKIVDRLSKPWKPEQAVHLYRKAGRNEKLRD